MLGELIARSAAALRITFVRRTPSVTSGPTERTTPQLMELENRILMSASPLAEIFAAQDLADPADLPDDIDTLHQATSPEALTAPFDTTSPPSDPSDETTLSLLQVAPDSTPHDPTHALELVVVDRSIGDYQALLDDLQASGEPYQVHLLDSTRDGIQQITQLLHQTDNVDALHIFSHGTEGAVRLGNGWLSDATLEGHAKELLAWSDQLSSEADILFYGCNLAETEAGQTLTGAVAALTGTDVAASTDLTGSQSLGGDWTLEHHHGVVETSTLFSNADAATWQGLLGTLTVNTTADYTSADARWGDTSSIDALLLDSGSDGKISLREALVAANQTANVTGPDAIFFNLAGTGVQTISVMDQALPVITDAVILDATTQTGFTQTPLVQLDGTFAGTLADGLQLAAGSDGSTIRGFAINGFANHGILIIDSSMHLVVGNAIGTDPEGTATFGNGGDGIAMTQSANNTIGGATTADRNIIAGQGGTGISITGALATGNVLQGNVIGTDVTGTENLGNGASGISIRDQASDNLIGGRGFGEGNTIAFNAAHGIEIQGGEGNSILLNRIYENAEMAIDLAADGVTPNDQNDVDAGPNALQNSAVISNVAISHDYVHVFAQLNSTANASFDVDYYVSSTVGAGGHNEAERHLGSRLQVTTDGSGNVNLYDAFAANTISEGDHVTAIVTDAAGNSSELSLSVTATHALNLHQPSDTTIEENQTIVELPQAIQSSNLFESENFSISGTGSDDSLFLLDDSHRLTFRDAPDFEAPADANLDNVYEVHLASITFTSTPSIFSLSVTVTPTNDHIPIFTSPDNSSVLENQSIVQTLTATDADLPTQTISFAIAGTGHDDALFTIDDLHQLTFLTNPDYEAPTDHNLDNTYEVDVVANDNQGGTTTQSITVVVQPTNDNAPVFTSPPDHLVFGGQTIVTTLTAEDADSPQQTVSFTIAGTGADDHLFTIDDSQQLTLATPVSFDNPTDSNLDHIYEVHVLAMDGLGGMTQQAINVCVVPDAITVTTTNDEHDGDTTNLLSLLANPGGTGISLREALIATNNTVNAPTTTRVHLPDGHYVLDRGDGDDTGHHGDLDITNDVILIGSGARETIVDGNYLDKVFDIHEGSTATISGITIRGGQSSRGALLVHESAILNLSEAAIRDNIGSNFGGGGHIHGALHLDRVTLQDNTALHGGGLYFHGADESSLTNVTISGNTATSGEGGAIWSDSAMTITHSTIVNNTGSVTGGIHFEGNGEVLLAHSILGNHGDNANTALTSGDFNVDSDGTAMLTGEHDVVPAQLLLNPLGDYGGPTNTHAPIGSSVALNPTGSNSTTTVDQRSILRDSLPDIGAFEGSIGSPINPIVDSDSQANTISDHAFDGTAVGITAFAVDSDSNSEITYSLDHHANGRFAINSATGVVVVADSSLLATSSDSSHTITVRATSSDTSWTTQTFTIQVEASNSHAPVFSTPAVTDLLENTRAVLTVQASDPDAPTQPISYTIQGGVDADLFAIHSVTGDLEFVTAPDFENPADSDKDNVYDIEIAAEDTFGSVTVQTFTVSVLNRNEAPEMLGTLVPSITAIEDTLTDLDLSSLTITDPDAGTETIRLSLSTSGGGQLTADSRTGLAIDTADATLHIRGSLADINAMLATPGSIHYVGAENVNGTLAETITLSANDFGNSGDGGAQETVLGLIRVDIAAVNDDPFNQGSLPIALDVFENTATPIDLSAIEFADVDAGNAELLVLLQTGGGTLVADHTDGLTVIGSGTSTVELVGDLATLNAFFDGNHLDYTTAGNTSSPPIDLLQIFINDRQNSGTGGGDSVHLGDVQLNVLATNDALQAIDDTFTSLSTGIQGNVARNDIHSDDETVTAILLSQPSHGQLSFLADGTFTYTPDTSFTGSDTFQYRLEDSSNSSSNQATATIQVNRSVTAFAFATSIRGNVVVLASSTVTMDTGLNSIDDSAARASADPLTESTSEADRENNQSQHDPFLLAANGVFSIQANGQVVTGRLTPSFTQLLDKDDSTSHALQQATSSAFYDSENRSNDVSWAIPNYSAQRTPAERNQADRFLDRLVAAEAYLTDQSLIWNQLDTLSEQMRNDDTEFTLAVGSIASVSTTLSAGYVLWMLRSGQLVTSLAAQLPSWKLIDPLIVFDQLEADQVGEYKCDSLVEIIERSTEYVHSQSQT